MKKNVMMRSASALLVLVLLTTCIISGTFAKYTTSVEGTDSARVAYWGFNQSAAITIDLFNDTYTNNTNNETVKSINGDDVIAPGTSREATFAFGSIYTQKNATIKAPEVDYNFTVEPTITGDENLLNALNDNSNFKWTLKMPDGKVNEYDTTGGLVSAIKTMDGFTDGTKSYKAGALPEIFTDAAKAYTIGWKWAFETADDNSTDKNEMAEQDTTDTAMGNDKTLGNIIFKITVTATQID